LNVRVEVGKLDSLEAKGFNLLCNPLQSDVLGAGVCHHAGFAVEVYECSSVALHGSIVLLQKQLRNFLGVHSIIIQMK